MPFAAAVGVLEKHAAAEHPTVQHLPKSPTHVLGGDYQCVFHRPCHWCVYAPIARLIAFFVHMLPPLEGSLAPPSFSNIFYFIFELAGMQFGANGFLTSAVSKFTGGQYPIVTRVVCWLNHSCNPTFLSKVAKRCKPTKN
jgi:hypothetical protein